MTATVTLERVKYPCQVKPSWDDKRGLFFAVVETAIGPLMVARAKGKPWRVWPSIAGFSRDTSCERN